MKNENNVFDDANMAQNNTEVVEHHNDNILKYYSPKNILSMEAKYNIIFGERSNGKTTSILDLGILDYCKNGHQMGIIRRWDEDFRGNGGTELFSGIVSRGLIKKYTKNKFNEVVYRAKKWYLANYDEKKNKYILDSQPFAFGFSLTAYEHGKSISYPNIKTVLFDEFLTRNSYLKDEFVIFMNVVSTIVRERTDVTFFLCGNTVNKHCPYFIEMGLRHIENMKPGDIDVYTYGDSANGDNILKIAVEYSDGLSKKGKPSDIYFSFDNPRLKMITTGAWELDLYPHCPYKYKPKDILITYFIIFDEHILQCEIVEINEAIFTFIHEKTTPIKDENNDIVFQTEYDARPNYSRNILKPSFKFQEKILWFFKSEKVFYQNNELGELVRNYLIWCKNEK